MKWVSLVVCPYQTMGKQSMGCEVYEVEFFSIGIFALSGVVSKSVD